MINVLLLKALRDLKAQRAQTIALIVIVTLGVACFVAFAGAYRDLSTSYNHTYEQLRFADVTLAVEGMPASEAARRRDTAGVVALSERLIVDTGLELPPGANPDSNRIRARLIGLPASHPAVNDVLILKGRALTPDERGAVLLESHFAAAYGLKPGDAVRPLINGRVVTMTVAGIAASPEYLIVSPSKQEIIPSARTFAVLFLPLAEAQRLVGLSATVNNLAVLFAPQADGAATVKALQDELAPFGLRETTLRKDQPSHAALQLDLDGYRELADAMPALILFVAAASVFVMMGRLVRSQQTQIGVMKALGYNDRAVMGGYLLLAMIIGATGALAGVALGLPLVSGITLAYASELGIPFVKTRVYADLVIEGALVSLVITALAGLGPARAAARLAPAQAMRQNPAAALARGRTSLIERLLPLPLWLRLPLRNTLRVPHRLVSSGLGVISAFVLLLVAWGMVDSINILMERNFRTVERWDFVAAFNGIGLPATRDQTAAWPGVRQVEAAVQSPAILNLPGKDQEVVLTAFASTQTMHVLQLDDGVSAEEALARGKIVLTAAIARKHKLALGAPVTVTTPAGLHVLKLGGVVDELMSSTAYVSMEQAQAWLGLPAPAFNVLYLTVEPQHARQIQDDLYHLPGVSGVTRKSSVEKDWRSLMGLFYAFTGVLFIMAGVMAFALLFNVMTVNVLERQRELATMRAVGAGWRRIALYITLESVILWLLTLAPGLLLGRWVAEQMGALFESDLFAFPIIIAPASYAITALAILLTMILAALPAIRNVNRLNLAEATKLLT